MLRRRWRLGSCDDYGTVLTSPPVKATHVEFASCSPCIGRPTAQGEDRIGQPGSLSPEVPIRVVNLHDIKAAA